MREMFLGNQRGFRVMNESFFREIINETEDDSCLRCRDQPHCKETYCFDLNYFLKRIFIVHELTGADAKRMVGG